MTTDKAGSAVQTSTREAVAFLDAGIAKNKAQLAKRFLDLARILSSEQPPGEADWKLAKASIALTLGILARDDDQVVEMMADRDDDLQEWLLATLHEKRSADSRQRPVKRRAKRNR